MQSISRSSRFNATTVKTPALAYNRACRLWIQSTPESSLIVGTKACLLHQLILAVGWAPPFWKDRAWRRDSPAHTFFAEIGVKLWPPIERQPPCLEEVDPGVFEEADAFAKVGSPLLLPFIPSLHLCLDFSAVPPCVQLKGFKDIPQLL